ncbi:MAG TPA: glycosyltransferase 87 family protein [Tepidisphaeraceae bacterium]|nr:glycosyltransferase 87 family protein [Tepidisphaeraceae bacterium]
MVQEKSGGGRLDGWALGVLAIALVATAGKLWLALRTYGSNDVLYWERFLQGYRDLGGVELYRQHWLFNHPPFMIHVLRAMGWLTSVTGIWFPFWLRLPAILADLGSLLLVYKLAGFGEESDGREHPPLRGGAKRDGHKERARWVALMLMAASPISIMVSGFHGNTDPVMIFFVLLSIYLIERKWPVGLAGVAMGMGLSIKVVPVIFLPAIVLYLPSWRRRIEYVAAVGATFALVSLPYIVQDPLIVAKKVLGYGSLYGHWGLSRVLTWMPPGWGWLDAGFERYGRYGVVAIVIAAAFWMNRQSRRPALFAQCGLIMFLFMTLSPGFGIQYVAWLVPWVVGLGTGACVLCYATTGVFQFLVYTYWSQGLPWYFADSDHVRDWKGYIVNFEVACWVAVVVVLVMFLRRQVRWRCAAATACGAEAATITSTDPGSGCP